MIDWMQRHKKWLVITIWISTISFIAAGMVGWGTYDFSLSQDIIAKVGKVEIDQRQFQSRYNQLYAQYNTDGKLDSQKAKDLKLEDIALQSLIERALVQNFALDLGLRVMPQEIATEITKLEYFQKNGQFDPTLYKDLLKQNNIKPKDFESDLANDLLVQKIANLIPSHSTTPLELETFSLFSSLEDEVKIKILTQAKISLTQNQMHSYWQSHQEQFKYPAKFKIEYLLIKENSQNPSEKDLQNLYEKTKSQYLDDKNNIQPFKQVRDKIIKEQKLMMAEEKALKEYIALKKAKNQYGQEKIILENDKNLDPQILDLLKNGQVSETFKPIKTSEGFMVLKILEKTPQLSKTFEDAQKEIAQILHEQERIKALKLQAQNLIKTGFQGENLGFIKPSQNIKNLNQDETHALLSKLFTSPTKRGFLEINGKIIVFEILNQKLLTPKNAQQIMQENQQFVEIFKRQAISKEFYKTLENKYKITIFGR